MKWVDSWPATSMPEVGLRRLHGGVLLCLLTLVYLVTATTSVWQSFDTMSSAAGAHAMAHHGGPWVEDIDEVFFTRPGPDGHTVVDRLPMTMLPAVPAYGVHRVLGGDVATSVLDLSYVPAAVTAALLMVLAAAGMFRLLLPEFGRERALVSAGIFALGTGAWSVAADAMWTHTAAMPALVLAMLGLARGRPVVAGLGFALAVATRPHLAVVAAAGGLAWAWQTWSRAEPSDRSERRRAVGGLVVIGVLSLAGVVFVMGWNQVTSPDGVPRLLTGIYTRRIDALEAVAGSTLLDDLGNVVLLLVSPLRGLLPYTPIALVVLPGVRRPVTDAPAWLRGVAVGGVGYVVVQGLVNSYTGGDAFFGARLALEALVVWWPLLVRAGWRAWDERPARRSLLVAAAAISVGLHALGATVFHLGMGVTR